MADDSTQNTPTGDEQQTSQTSGKAPKFEGEFDAERATRLIENLRKEVSDLKAEKTSLAEDLQKREDAEKSDADRTAEALQRAKDEAAKATRDLYVERAVRKHSLPDDLVEFLTGETEEEIGAKAERLAKFGTSKSDDAGDEQQEPNGDDVSSRPTPSLRPGHGGAPTQAFDAAAVAEAARTDL